MIINKKTFSPGFGETLPYTIAFPEGTSSEPYSLVLFLHGAGQRGVDWEHTKYGFGSLVDYCQRFNKNSIIVAPQCPLDQQWVNVPWSDMEHEMPKYPSTPLRLTYQLLNMLLDSNNIDRQQLYITGLSMGGFGTWDFIMREPTFFRAAMPICGGADVDEVNRIGHLPIATFHGDLDDVVDPYRSRAVVAALKSISGNIRYTEYSGVDHDSWTQTYDNDSILTSFFSAFS